MVASDGFEEVCQKTVSRLLSALLGTEAALVLQSRISSGNIASEIARLFERVQKGEFGYIHYRPLVELVIQKAPDLDIWNAVLSLITLASQVTPPPRPIASLQQTPWLRNTSSFANSAEYRRHVDTILKEELGDLHADIHGFLEAYFGNISGLDSATHTVLDKCKEGDRPLYNEEKGWRDWPEHAVEKEVLKWLANVIGELVQHFPLGVLARVSGGKRRIFTIRPLYLVHTRKIQRVSILRSASRMLSNSPTTRISLVMDMSQTD
ncbi:hypothetical protein ACJ73_02084 [Blastomyces percursus]|uniref:Uncharacterized protein n=1 Tax=Blastomyces percursus TaxID=1658174 RepID=A0A1J9QDC1_9EURO|nr:hypothetical protein ACJ73_02084 [Blastomyces percursus]